MQLLTTALSLSLSLSLCALPLAQASSGGISFQANTYTPQNQQQQQQHDPDLIHSLGTAANVLELTKRSSAKGYNSRSAAWALQKSAAKGQNCGHRHRRGSSALISLEEGEEFDTVIRVGRQKVAVIVDTGSSDTWLAEDGFQCANMSTGAPEPESACLFGPLYHETRSFRPINDENFNITYGDNETVTGTVGTDRVNVAGFKVRQQIGVVNYAIWEGDGTTSGLMGIAYPSLTSAYAGTNPKADNSPAGAQITYNPVIDTIFNNYDIPHLFSLAIDRDVNGTSGYLAIGGLPPVRFKREFTTTPILMTEVTGYPQNYDFYTINIDNLVIDNVAQPGAGGLQYQYIVDSGTTLAYIPNEYADAVAAAYDPPAVFNEDAGAYLVDCDAKSPQLAITIAGATFQVNPLDMILLNGADINGTEYCISGVTQGGTGTDVTYILGDTFQHNVVTVFDVGNTQLHFAPREFYASNDPVKM